MRSSQSPQESIIHHFDEPTRLLHYVETVDELYHYGTELFSLISSGVIKIKVFKEYPFTAQGVQQAQTDLTGGKTTGKLVIKVSDD